MNETGEVIQSVLIGLVVASFFLKTCRVLQIIGFCKKCLVCKHNRGIIHRILIWSKVLHLTMFDIYCLISEDSSAIEYGKRLLHTLHSYDEKSLECNLLLTLAVLCENHGKLVDAEELFQKAAEINKEIGNSSEEAFCYEKLGIVCDSLGKTVKATESFENALKVRIQVGDKTGQARNYSNLGAMFQSLGKYIKAKEYLEKAISITKESGDRDLEASSHGNLGTVLERIGEYNKAKEHHEKSLAIKQEIGDQKGKAPTYVNLGIVFLSLSEYVRAKEYFVKALMMYQEAGERMGEAICHGNIGIVLQRLGQYLEAKNYHEKCLKIRHEIGNKDGEASSYCNLGTVFLVLGEYTEARGYFERAIEIVVKTGDKLVEAKCYGNLGNVFQHLGKYRKAQDYYQKALFIEQEIGHKKGEAACYGNQGNLFQRYGNYAKARDYYEKAIRIQQEIGDINGEATSYDGLGTVYQILGDYSKAKDYYEKAVAIIRKLGNRRGEASFHLNSGTLLQFQGEYFKAKDHYEKALAIAQEIGARKEEALCKGNLGTVFKHLGEYVKAKDYYEKALTIHKEMGNRGGEASCYGNLGALFLSLGEYVEAQHYFEKDVGIRREIGDKRAEVTSYINVGNVFFSLGKYKKADENFQKALSTSKLLSYRQGEAGSYSMIGRIHRVIGDHQTAKEYFEKAMSISEEFGDKKGLARDYEHLGSLCISLSQNVKAKEYLERALAISREIRDGKKEFLILCRLTNVSILEGAVLDAFARLFTNIQNCEELRGAVGDSDQFKICFAQQCVFPYWILSEMFRLAEDYNQALCVLELGRSRALTDTLSAQYSLANQVSTDFQSWTGIENVMDKQRKSTCLYISYTPRNLVLWILKRNSVFKIHEREFSDVIQGGLLRTWDEFFAESFRQFGVLSQGSHQDRYSYENQTKDLSTEGGNFASFRPIEEDEDQEPDPKLRLYYDMIIAPIADFLEEPNVIIVPDRQLYRVPFAALQAKNGKFLSEMFRIRFVPSLTTLKLIQDSPDDYHSQTGALIVGDPEVGEVIYKGRRKVIPPLPCARREAEMIGRLLNIEPLIGLQATKRAVLQRIKSVSLIHLAAHGNVDRGEIALAPLRPIHHTPRDEEFVLSMTDISQVKLRAKLVVLSCCHSAQGQIRTEGVVGIARAFLGSGARSVLVALWALEDSATEQLMKCFYAHLARGESASESLHQAMKWMRRNGFSLVSQWAPFMLIGDDVTFDFRVIFGGKV